MQNSRKKNLALNLKSSLQGRQKEILCIENTTGGYKTNDNDTGILNK